VRLRALPAKQFGGLKRRPLRAPTPCYTRWANRRQEFVLGGKPDALKGVGAIHQKVWKQYQSHLDRTPPLDRARFYARQMEARRLRSTAALERSMVSRRRCEFRMESCRARIFPFDCYRHLPDRRKNVNGRIFLVAD
jgi:hypothetical protein